jgi:predicted Holliday junction resolvase-like endonuclease
MARGWESKSVEDQIGDAEVAKEAHAKRHLSPQDRVRENRRQSLLLSRAQVIGRLKTVTNARYRAQLEHSLEHLDAQLREIEKTERPET